MRRLKKAGFIATAIILTFFIACGGENESSPGSDHRNGPDNDTTVSISITKSLNMLVGETKTLNITTQNTDFTVSVSPASGSGCVKSGNNTVSCTPTKAGIYNVTVTAGADETQKAASVLTVKSLNKALLVQLINSYRTTGCYCGNEGYFRSTSPLTWSDTIESAAYDHSLDMLTNNFFSHTGSDGSDTGDRLERRDYVWITWGENIAWGYGTEEEVIQGWMSSSGHCSNIMYPDFEEMGIAKAGIYWTLDLAKR